MTVTEIFFLISYLRIMRIYKLSEEFKLLVIADVFFFLPENNKLSGNAGNGVAAAFFVVFSFYVRSSVRPDYLF